MISFIGGPKVLPQFHVSSSYFRNNGVDYDEIFSPIVKMTTLRFLLGVMVAKNVEQEQMDVKTTFVHRDLEEDIYMSQPTGFIGQWEI